MGFGTAGTAVHRSAIRPIRVIRGFSAVALGPIAARLPVRPPPAAAGGRSRTV